MQSTIPTNIPLITATSCCLCNMAGSYTLHGSQYCWQCLDDVCYLAEILGAPNFPSHNTAKGFITFMEKQQENKIKKYAAKNILFDLDCIFRKKVTYMKLSS